MSEIYSTQNQTKTKQNPVISPWFPFHTVEEPE